MRRHAARSCRRANSRPDRAVPPEIVRAARTARRLPRAGGRNGRSRGSGGASRRDRADSGAPRRNRARAAARRPTVPGSIRRCPPSRAATRPGVARLGLRLAVAARCSGPAGVRPRRTRAAAPARRPAVREPGAAPSRGVAAGCRGSTADVRCAASRADQSRRPAPVRSVLGLPAHFHPVVGGRGAVPFAGGEAIAHGRIGGEYFIGAAGVDLDIEPAGSAGARSRNHIRECH